MPERPAVSSGPVVALAYTALAIVMTWPLAAHLGSAIAGDLGDPAFICWVMLWTGGQVSAALHGNTAALHDYWNGNIFYPHSLTIAYSEHFTPQMLQALPLYGATGNIVLCYNVLVLSTFVLSGLAMYWLVRELTARPAAAFLAGLAFAYAPYRMAQIPHLQVLSSYWMPLALLGFRRYFVAGRARSLAGAAGALALQNLSCGYFMLFFSPFAAAYCVYEMAQRRLLSNWRVWRSLVLAALFVAVVTWPFAAAYMKLKRGGDVGVRSAAESVLFSADVLSFATASEVSRLWSDRIRAFPKAESDGFPGLVILSFVAAGFLWSRRSDAPSAGRGFFLGALVVSMLLALGPIVMVAGQHLGPGPYALLLRFVPGFDGLRVPARYLMLVVMFLAILTGLGAAAALARWRRAGAAILVIGSIGILAEAWIAPMSTNRPIAVAGFAPTPNHLNTGDAVSPTYQAVREASGKVVLIEFPFGEPAYDMLAVFYAGYHRRPLVNGYSGYYPEDYLKRANFLSGIPGDFEAATRALAGSGATYALVHEGAFLNGRGHELSDWLRSTGAQIVATDGSDKLFQLR